jgi:hypothetical protein
VRIKVSQNDSMLYERVINKSISDDELLKIAYEIRIIIYENKNDDLFIANYIEFLMWLDEKTNYQNFYLESIMKECIEYANKICFLNFFIQFKDKVDKYNLYYIMDSFWNLDLNRYNHSDLYDTLNILCDLYNFDYKDKILCLLNRIVNKTTLQIINDNFEFITSNDIVSIVVFINNKKNLEDEYKHACVFKDILDSIYLKK